jgi:hypothetical protein
MIWGTGGMEGGLEDEIHECRFKGGLSEDDSRRLTSPQHSPELQMAASGSLQSRSDIKTFAGLVC